MFTFMFLEIIGMLLYLGIKCDADIEYWALFVPMVFQYVYVFFGWRKK